MLIAKCAAEKRSIFYTYCSVVNLGVKFVYKIYFNHEFSELENHQQLNLIEKILNKGCFENFIIKIVILDDNAQKLSIIFLKTAILLFTNL